MLKELTSLDLSLLNKAQYQACIHKDGPAVVYAGAGSGKTRVICSRIGWLITIEKVPASSILAVTFTNKAAKEMKERINEYIGERNTKNLIISTFHSFCARFLRIYSSQAGFQPGFTIFDDNDQKSLLKDLLKQLNIPDKLLSVSTVKSKIDKIKNLGLTPEEYLREIKNNADIITKENQYQLKQFGEYYDPELIQKVYDLYQRNLKKQNAMDFNDLLLEMYKLLENNNSVLQSMQNRFKYFLIDEFQDTNPIQFKLIKILCSHTNNLFIVGDDDQSIYSWRGAEPSFILNFDKEYKNVKVFKLEENYRSSDKIIGAATSVIKNNYKRADKTIFTNKINGTKIKFKSCEDPYSEARYIANEIYSAVQNNEVFSNFCILYRTNAQSRSLEDELRRRMLPYIIYGSVRFYERAEIKILLAYLKLIINSTDEASLLKIINTPRRGFGEKAVQKLKELSLQKNESMLKTLTEVVYGTLENDLSRSLSGVKDFIMNYQKWKNNILEHNKPSVTLAQIVSDINFEIYLKSTHPEDFDERWLNVIELKNALIEFENTENEELLEEKNGLEKLSLFIEQAMLTIEPTVYNVQQGSANAITLMTIHSAKGLEYQNIFLAGLEEGVLPHQNSLDSPEAIEEERRLMYVAVTRAKNNLVITNCKKNRYKDFLPAQESRFISEIPEKYIDILDHTGNIKKEFGKISSTNKFIDKPRIFKGDELLNEQKIESGNEEHIWRKGQRVTHKVFGEGIIREIEKSSQGYRLKIKFEKNNVGEKTLIHTYVNPI
ncbi:UvrD-helicase domain-containing protein [Pigmentibacter sp. JX0631]|uniref:ATP-dependent helicase n=1 Tax=Pigmentibacter sp. JX0631 TaxID=2976982 RepID=UPI0024697A53|nr:UvrD-helicase domain-containing protein [Pigmentibacter sp. JX0631]WGL61365.1 UvrD-helicase domain-containing protein [Pigmentibacter sp. JX0631]